MEENKIGVENWGRVNGQDVYLYQLHNSNGVSVSITNFGASITNIVVPDKTKQFVDIALGYDSLQGYIDDPYYMGGIVGRYANRIAGGLIELDGEFHQLTVKPGGYHHHGGTIGFNKKVWDVADFIHNTESSSIKMTYISPDREEGFPGNLSVTVTYTLNNQNQLVVDFHATTDKTTLINLTQHTYFNLAGHANGSILDHQLLMSLNSYLPVNTSQVPTGEIASVGNTPFDFKTPRTIGERIDTDHEQLILSNGYDHSWVIKTKNSAELKFAARISDPESERTLTVYTTEPAIHLYTGNFLDGSITGKAGFRYPLRSGLCLETQHYPDAPNKPQFPSTVLRKGMVYKSKTIFDIGISK